MIEGKKDSDENSDAINDLIKTFREKLTEEDYDFLLIQLIII